MKWYALFIFSLFSLLGIAMLRVEIADVERETADIEVELGYQRSLSAYRQEQRSEEEFQKLLFDLELAGKLP
jgi:hypothetical protein